MNEANGKRVIETLAQTYYQLYLVPGDGALEKYRDIVQAGDEPDEWDLSHFKTNEKDSLTFMDTPEGKVCVVTLYERDDFVLFLQIMANRCAPVKIPDTQGASILSGVINWRKIEAHEEAFLREEREKGVKDPDWGTEFKRFTSDKKNYLDVLIVLSVGPYSGIPARTFGFDEDKWITLSNTIRLYHECTHFICRKRYPDMIDAIWDELVADAVGIYAAFGKFDPGIEERFLGIRDGIYEGGRLENYLKDVTEDEKKKALDELSVKITGILEGFETMISDKPSAEPFEIVDLLQGSKEKYW
ncbi:MAG: hypothetical protein K6G22_04640 [Lachnospiraceae bacterium]|nr:hypothetical protein [Lachnospiraceae bacterium]